MATIRRFEDILAWQKSREMAKAIYQITGTSGFMRDRPLQSQMRRAVASVMANIAEGFERESGDRDFRHFLSMAKGSAGELRSHLYIALDAGLIQQDVFQKQAEATADVCRMLNAFMAYLGPKPNTKRPKS